MFVANCVVVLFIVGCYFWGLILEASGKEILYLPSNQNISEVLEPLVWVGYFHNMPVSTDEFINIYNSRFPNVPIAKAFKIVYLDKGFFLRDDLGWDCWVSVDVLFYKYPYLVLDSMRTFGYYFGFDFLWCEVSYTKFNPF